MKAAVYSRSNNSGAVPGRSSQVEAGSDMHGVLRMLPAGVDLRQGTGKWLPGAVLE